MRVLCKRFALGVVLLSLCGQVAADGLDALGAAVSGGTPNFDGRLRYEHVEQDNPLADANALTLRARLGYTTEKWNGFDALLEYEGVFDFSEDAYNSTRNGQTGRPVVADPEGSELNQAVLRYTGAPDTVIRLGRQRLILDNARFIGNVGWRQNEQTFDSASIVNSSLAKTTLTYAYLERANGIVFNNIDLRGQVVNVRVAPVEALALTAYAYLLDFDLNPPARQDTQTLGLRAAGAIPIATAKLLYALEYAKQSDYAEAPATVDADYFLAELGVKLGPVTPMVAYEVLGGDGAYGFQTPLATLHAFQGWADQFLLTPAAGIRDRYVSLSGEVAPLKLSAIYHRYQADAGGADYGDELNLLAALPVGKALNLALKFADYSADTFLVDTQKIWAQAEYKF